MVYEGGEPTCRYSGNTMPAPARKGDVGLEFLSFAGGAIRFIRVDMRFEECSFAAESQAITE
jgi:hypothetical protein